MVRGGIALVRVEEREGDPVAAILAADFDRPETWPEDLDIPDPGPVGLEGASEHKRLRKAWLKSRVLKTIRAGG